MYSTSEAARWKSIDGKSHLLAFGHVAHIGFIDVSMYFHFGEVVSNRKQDRRLEGGGNGLAHIHGARDNDTVHGGANDRVVDIDCRLTQCGLGSRFLCLVDFQLSQRRIISGLACRV